MRVEHLQSCLVVANREEWWETVNWEQVVDILQTWQADNGV